MTAQSADNYMHDRSDKTFRVFTFCLLCAGVGLLILAVLSTIDLIQLRVFGHEATGHVIHQEIKQEQVERYDDGREYTEDIDSYYAVVSFTTSRGAFTITSWDSGTNAPLYPTNSQVTVVYLRTHPERARIQREISGFHGVFGPLMLFVFGAALTGTSRLINFFTK